MYKYIYTVKHGDIVSINIYQCCGVEAGGAEIIWGPGAGARAENKFKLTCYAVSLENARTNKS